MNALPAWECRGLPLIQDGTLRADGIFTRSFALDDVADAFATVAAQSPDCVEVQLRP